MSESDQRSSSSSADIVLPRADPVIAPIFRPAAPAGAMPPAAPFMAPPLAAERTPATERPISRVYDQLVEGEDDVIGLIAYALYKRDKREWHMTWREKHTAEPTGRELEAYINSQMTAGQRERYRTAARATLDAYASVALDVERPEIVKEALAGRIETAARRMERRGSWYRVIPGAFFGALLFVLIVAVAIAVAVALEFDILDYLGLEAVEPVSVEVIQPDGTPIIDPAPAADPAAPNGAG